MSRPATWTKRRGGMILDLLDRLTRQAGKNLVLVTHSAEAAAIADQRSGSARRHWSGARLKHETARCFPLLWKWGGATCCATAGRAL